MKMRTPLFRMALCGLFAACLAGCFGKPPPEQRYLRVAVESTPCPGSASQQHRLPLGFKPLKSLENLDRTAVMTARDQVLTASLQYYWEGAPQDVVGGILRQGIECQSTSLTPVDYQPRVEHDAVLTGELTAFNVDYTDGGRFVVSLHLDLWTKNMGARISSGDFNAYAPLEDFRGDTIAKAATDALGRVTPKVVDWLDQGMPKLQKALERK
ncbi:hypothetical protein DVDV_3575 [Desulfovibrio sp. DV]|uniref:ABC transporter n=1 Tax=Desulfovibrio sp. DV TaxID=1844708 RepID=UPI00094BC498|nr:ABC transporter [Desulfovibrio sp. DV]OLN25156.1 hypothetical protein DVDV_3575 [Desulfovibrio sp. DV]